MIDPELLAEASHEDRAPRPLGQDHAGPWPVRWWICSTKDPRWDERGSFKGTILDASEVINRAIAQLRAKMGAPPDDLEIGAERED